MVCGSYLLTPVTSGALSGVKALQLDCEIQLDGFDASDSSDWDQRFVAAMFQGLKPAIEGYDGSIFQWYYALDLRLSLSLFRSRWSS